MTDDEFLRAFFDLSLPNSAFHSPPDPPSGGLGGQVVFRHRDHLRLAWLVIRREGAVAAEEVVAGGIRRFAAAHGHADRFHATLTRFWVRLVAHAIQAGPAGADFEAVLAAHPLLLDPLTPLRHWSRDTLFGAEARGSWREPDVVALPF